MRISFHNVALCNGLQSCRYILQMVQSEKKRPWWSVRRKIHSQVRLTCHDPNWLEASWCRAEAIKNISAIHPTCHCKSAQASSPAVYALCRLLRVIQRKLQSMARQARHSPAAGRDRLQVMSLKDVHA